MARDYGAGHDPVVRSVTANSGAQGACEAGQWRLRVRGALKSGLVGMNEATVGLRAVAGRLCAVDDAGQAQGTEGLTAGAVWGSRMKGMEMRDGKKPFYKAAWATERSLW